MINIYHIINSKKYLQADLGTDGFANQENTRIFLFPFEMLSGGTWLTDKGLRNNVSKISENSNNYALFSPIDNTQSTLLITGNEPICFRWVNSIKPSFNQPNPIVPNKSSIGFQKNFQVGDYYSVFPDGEINYERGEANLALLGQNYLNIETNIRISVVLPWVKDLNFSNLINYVYIVKGGPWTTNQLLMINSMTANVNAQSQKIISYTIELKSINLSMSESGREILNFFSFGMPGDNYPFPTISPTTNEPILDPVRKDAPLGITHIQEEHSYANAYGSISIFGGVADPFFILPTQKLLLYQPQPPQADPIQLNGTATNNYFVMWGSQPSQINIWNDYKEQLNNATFIGAYRENVGGLADINSANVQSTNDSVPYFPFYNKNWEIPGPVNNLVFDNVQSIYFQGTPGSTSPTFTFQSSTYSLAQLLNHNSIIYEGVYQYTNEITETQRFTIGSIPLIGKLWNVISMGYNPSFYINNTTLQSGQRLNLISPTSQTNLMLGQIQGTQTPANLSFYNDGKNMGTDGGKLNVCSMMFSLTDRYQDETRVIPNYQNNAWDNYFGNEPINGVYNTHFIGQSTYPDGSPTNWPSIPWYDNDGIIPTSPSTQGISQGFYIAGYKSQSVGMNSTILTFYSNLNSLSRQPVQQYYNLFNKSSKIKGIMSLWTDAFSFSIYQGNILDNLKIEWPQQLIPSSKTLISQFSLETNYYAGGTLGEIALSKNSNDEWIINSNLPSSVNFIQEPYPTFTKKLPPGKWSDVTIWLNLQTDNLALNSFFNVPTKNNQVTISANTNVSNGSEPPSLVPIETSFLKVVGVDNEGIDINTPGLLTNQLIKNGIPLSGTYTSLSLNSSQSISNTFTVIPNTPLASDIQKFTNLPGTNLQIADYFNAGTYSLLPLYPNYTPTTPEFVTGLIQLWTNNSYTLESAFCSQGGRTSSAGCGITSGSPFTLINYSPYIWNSFWEQQDIQPLSESAGSTGTTSFYLSQTEYWANLKWNNFALVGTNSKEGITINYNISYDIETTTLTVQIISLNIPINTYGNTNLTFTNNQQINLKETLTIKGEIYIV